MTFILFECHRSIDKTIDFYLYMLSWKSLVMEIQNLVVNPKLRSVNSNYKQYQFLIKSVSSKKSMTTFLNIKKKNLFGGSFLPKGNFS